MNTHADKTQENKSHSAANAVSQSKSSGESLFQLVDNRPEAIDQRKLQEMANNSSQVSQLRAFQDMANNSLQVKQAAQLQAMANNFKTQQQPTIQNKAEAANETAEVPTSEAVGKNNTGLPDNLKTGMENLSGMSLDDVKVHRNSDKPAQLHAHAYAQGTDIHLGPGQEKHLPHEAWHVVQQKQGRVKPTVQMKGNPSTSLRTGINVNDDADLEKEADSMGSKALQRKSKKSIVSPSIVHQKNQTIQRMVAIANADMGGITDALILNNLDYAKGHFGAPVGDFGANKKFNQMGESQRIGIVEHGLPGEIGNYDANEVADILTDQANHIPKSTTSVVLYSCFAATDKENSPKSSLVQGLSTALKDKGYEIGVEGQVGVGFGFKGIGERTTKGDFKTGVASWAKALDELIGSGKKYEAWKGGQFSLAQFGLPGEMLTLVTADKLLEIGGSFDALAIGAMNIEDKATHISNIMAPFWRDAAAFMGGNLHDHLDGWLRIKTYVSGDEFVQKIGI